MADPQVPQSHAKFDRIASVSAGLIVISLAVFLLIRNEPIASAQLFFVMRVVLSFAVAVLGATIPGFLNISWKGPGLAIRAGGALALFVLTFVYTPDLAQTQSISAGPGGIAAGTITGGTFNIDSSPLSQRQR